MSDKDSQVINLIRFPLAVMVVLIHCGSRSFVNGGEWFRTLVSDVLPAIAVPLFFLISGFLFFQGLEQWDWEKWKGKMRRRVKTLLIPYLIWVTLFICYVYLHQCRLSVSAGENWLPLGQWFADNGGIRMWWDSNVALQDHPFGYKVFSAHPYHEVLWFVRDLIVINLLSPLIFFLLSKAGRWVLVILLVLNLLRLWPPFHSISISCVFFYSAGAYLAIKGKGLVETLFRVRIVAWVLAGILVIPMVVFRNDAFFILAKQIWIIAWGVSFVTITALIAYDRNKRERLILFLADSTFFVYVTHPVVQSNIKQALMVLPPFKLGEVTVLLLTAILTVAFCVFCYFLLRQFLPRLCTVLCGR